MSRHTSPYRNRNFFFLCRNIHYLITTEFFLLSSFSIPTSFSCCNNQCRDREDSVAADILPSVDNLLKILSQHKLSLSQLTCHFPLSIVTSYLLSRHSSSANIQTLCCDTQNTVATKAAAIALFLFFPVGIFFFFLFKTCKT